MAKAGRVVADRYRLVEELGSGGFGRVWRARDESLDIDVAVKELRIPPEVPEADRAQRLARAEREGRNSAKLRDHPNIVTVYDVVVDEDAPWIIMQLVDGPSLAQHLDEHGPVQPDLAEKIAISLLEALDSAHDAGIVHRDVKPANVLLSDDGRVLLTDFGIAVHNDDTSLTTTGMFIGSAEYMAPERLLGNGGLPESDLFSLGVTLYQAVEGVSPFRRDTHPASLAAVLTDQPAPPQEAGNLEPLITQLMDKDPSKRPTVSQALALTGSETPPQAKTKVLPLPGRSPKKRASKKRTPWQWYGTLLTLALVFACGIVGLDHGYDAEVVAEAMGSPLSEAFDDSNPAGWVVIATVAGLLFASSTCVYLTTELVRRVLTAIVDVIGDTVVTLVMIVTVVVSFAAPTFAFTGGMHVLLSWTTPTTALWTALVLDVVLLAIALGWLREVQAAWKAQGK